jgi:hypothetical protein
VATDWGPLVQTGVGGLLALAGSVLGVSIQGRQQRRMERDRRRERAAELLAEVQALLTDAAPDPLGLFATEETSKQIFTALEDRWERTRIPLLTLAASDPSKRVCDSARDLEAATANTLIWDRRLAGDVVAERDLSEARDAANQHHADARRLLGELLEAIRRA